MKGPCRLRLTVRTLLWGHSHGETLGWGGNEGLELEREDRNTGPFHSSEPIGAKH